MNNTSGLYHRLIGVNHFQKYTTTHHMTQLNKARLEILWAMAEWSILPPIEAQYYKDEWRKLNWDTFAMPCY
jgi:hypothetical protein